MLPILPRLRSLRVVLLLGLLPLAAQSQQVLYPGLEGQPLLDALRAGYSPSGTIGYGPARDALFAWEQSRNGNLRAVYTGYTIVLSGDPSDSALAQGVNTEHTWPQSLGMGSEPRRSDMHNLFPTRVEVNAARGNDPFAEIPDAETDTWYRLAQAQSNIPAVALDEWSEVDHTNPAPGYDGRFEPREDHGGNAARAMFYVYAVYQPSLASGFLDAQLGDLLAWHAQDPVDAFEADRSAFIASRQGNQNPFVLDSTLARRAFAPDGGGDPPGDPTDDLLISEYVEGSSLNKAVELYNGTAAALDLGAGGYSLQVFFNGSTTPGTVIALSGTVAPGDVFVLAEGTADAAILAVADQTTTEALFNGDDAVVLYRGSQVVDAIGQVGFDPGDEWGTGLVSTKDNTLRRRPDACAADADPNDAFDPAEHFAGFANDTFDGLGSAALDCEATSAVTADIERVGTSPVPASGGPLSYRVTLTNTTAEAQTLTAEVNATLPSGAPFGPVRGPRTVRLPAGGSVGPLTFTETVPGVAPAGTYTVTLTLASGGEEIASDRFTFDKTAAREGGEAAASVDAAFALSPAYPNPMRDAATVRFAVAEAGEVRLAVYDVLGREVAVLADGVLEAGEHAAVLDGSALPGGVYLVRMEAGSFVQTQRVTLVR